MGRLKVNELNQDGRVDHSDSSSEAKKLQESFSVKDLLVGELTTGNDVLDREFFYMLTEGKTQQQMNELKEEVTKDVMNFYDGVAKLEGTSPEENSRTQKFIQRDIDHWFSPWNLQGGKMDHELNDMLNAIADGKLSQDSLKWSVAAIAINNANEHPEFKRNIAGWVKNRCEEQGISLSELPKPVRKKFPELFKKNQIKM